MKKRTCLKLIFVLELAVASVAANAQNFPSRPVRIVTGGVGGQSDFTSRIIAQGLTAQLGQQVIVDNRASGVIPGQIVSQAAPDGYTLLLVGGTFTIGSLLLKTPYDPVRDFAPVSLPNQQPNVLVVHPSVAVKSARELIDLAKAKPGALNYSSGQSGSSSHLAAELFKYMANVNIVGIHYKSGATRMTDLIGGQVQMEFATPGAVAAHVKSGKLRPLAVTSAQPSALVPGLPTVSATGLPGYESVGMSGVYAPAKTPVSIVNLLSKEIARVVNQPDIKQKFFETGVEAVGGSPAELAAKIKSELERMGKVIKAAGIRGES